MKIISIILLISIYAAVKMPSSCYPPLNVETSKVYLKNGYLVSEDNDSPLSGACFIDVTNYGYDTVFIIENTYINDTIPGIAPNEVLAYSVSDTLLSMEMRSHFSVVEHRVLRNQTRRFLLLNQNFDLEHNNYLNLYYFRADSAGTQKTILLKVNSMDLGAIVEYPQ